MTPIGTPLQNDILKDYTPLGASDQTGTAEGIFQHGPHVSVLLAERDYGRVAPLKAVLDGKSHLTSIAETRQLSHGDTETG